MGALKQAGNGQNSAEDSVRASEGTESHPEMRHSESRLEALALGDTAGYIEFSPSRVTYVGCAHWMAIMRNV